MADCCTRKKLCYCFLLCFLLRIIGGAIGIHKWYHSGLNRWHGLGSTADFQKIIQERWPLADLVVFRVVGVLGALRGLPRAVGTALGGTRWAQLGTAGRRVPNSSRLDLLATRHLLSPSQLRAPGGAE